MFGRSFITHISADRIWLASGGRVRLCVQGRGYGQLRLQGEGRWVWGRFDEHFRVAVPQGAKCIEVALFGIGGLIRRQIVCDGWVNLGTPCLRLRPRVRTSQFTTRLPTLRRLAVRHMALPRLLRLQVAAGHEVQR